MRLSALDLSSAVALAYRSGIAVCGTVGAVGVAGVDGVAGFVVGSVAGLTFPIQF